MTTTAPPPSTEAPAGIDAHGWGDPFDPTGQAAVIASVPPRPGLLSLLENLDVGAADSATLLEAIAGWERLKSRAEAVLSRLYVHFVDQVAAEREPAAASDTTGEPQVAPATRTTAEPKKTTTAKEDWSLWP